MPGGRQPKGDDLPPAAHRRLMLHQLETLRSARPMPSLALLIPFFLSAPVFACVPGPGMFYAAAPTIPRGRRAGWFVAPAFPTGGSAPCPAAAFALAPPPRP